MFWSGVSNGRHNTDATSKAKKSDDESGHERHHELRASDGDRVDAEAGQRRVACTPDGDNITACDNTQGSRRPSGLVRVPGSSSRTRAASGSSVPVPARLLRATKGSRLPRWLQSWKCSSRTGADVDLGQQGRLGRGSVRGSHLRLHDHDGAADDLDVCATLRGRKWTPRSVDSDDWDPEVVFNGAEPDRHVAGNASKPVRACGPRAKRLTTAEQASSRPSGLTTTWTARSRTRTATSASNERPNDAGERVSTGVPDLHDNNNQNNDGNNLEVIWQWLTDDTDMDPNARRLRQGGSS